jgi:acetyl esterase/lipase
VVLLHGGYWLPGYGLDLMVPLADRLTSLGHATWNVEYRRTGAGGGVPDTLTDVAAAIDRLAGGGLPKGLDDKVLLVGHSAGGHLAVWAASRTARTPGGESQVALSGAISLGGVLNLTLAARRPASRVQVTGFVGGTPADVPESYALADPTLLVPASCPVWAVHAEEDQVVPAEQSTSYVAGATAVGAVAERVTVPGDHFGLIDPGAASFRAIRKRLE